MFMLNYTNAVNAVKNQLDLLLEVDVWLYSKSRCDLVDERG